MIRNQSLKMRTKRSLKVWFIFYCLNIVDQSMVMLDLSGQPLRWL